MNARSTKAINLVLSIGAVTYYGIMAVTAMTAGSFYVIRRLTKKDTHWELIQKPEDDVALDRRE